MIRSPWLTATVLGATLFWGTGCTLGPEPARPVTAADASDSYAYAKVREETDSPSVTAWWRTFGDPTTVELVELALQNNTDLQAAAARVLEAEAARHGPEILVRSPRSRPPYNRFDHLLLQLQRLVADRPSGPAEAHPAGQLGEPHGSRRGRASSGSHDRVPGRPVQGPRGNGGKGPGDQSADHRQLGVDDEYRRASIPRRPRWSRGASPGSRESRCGPRLGSGHRRSTGPGPPGARCSRRAAPWQQ